MNKLMLSALLFPVIALAEISSIEKTVLCDDAETVLQELTVKHGEEPLWFGNKPDSKFGVLVNPKTGSWSVIQFNEQRVCLIDDGEGFQIRKLSADKPDT